MGNTCSHSDFDVSNIDPTVHTDKMKTWNFKVADAKCNTCDAKHLRAIRKTCVDHGINQPWEIIDKAACKHEVIMIKNKTRDMARKRYDGRAQCVCCLNDVPVFITFEVKRLNGSEADIQTSEWLPDKVKTRQEQEQKKRLMAESESQ